MSWGKFIATVGLFGAYVQITQQSVQSSFVTACEQEV